jgi:hypothetical protein
VKTVLILMLFGYGDWDPAVSQHDYDTPAACQAAGEAAIHGLVQDTRISPMHFRFTCAPKG